MEPEPLLTGIVLVFAAALAALTVPLAACLLFASLAILWLNPHPLPGDFLLEHGLAMRLNSPALISIPIFGLAGELAVLAGISERLLNLADAVGGKSRYAVGLRTVLGCSLFASISGVGPAAVAAEGQRLGPAMIAAGFPKRTAAGSIACAASLSIVIPASVPLTVYAATVGITTNVVFAASFVPGLLLALALLAAMIARSRRTGAPVRPPEDAIQPVGIALCRAGWALLLPVLLLSSLFTGFLSAPEAAAFACAYALAAARLHGVRIAPGALVNAVARSASTAAAILILTAVAGLFVLLVNESGLANAAARLVHTGLGGRVGSILFMNAVLLLAGCVMDMPAIITLAAPLLLPLAELAGMSLPHFGVVVAMSIAVGLVTPPQAWNLAAASSTLGIRPWESFLGALPFLAAMLGVLVLVSFVPELSLWLPRLFGWPV